MGTITQRLEIERDSDGALYLKSDVGNAYLRRELTQDVAAFDTVYERVTQMILECNALISQYFDEAEEQCAGAWGGLT